MTSSSFMKYPLLIIAAAISSLSSQRCFVSAQSNFGTTVTTDEGMNLGGGIVTRTSQALIEKYADLSLDVRDVYENLVNKQNDDAFDIYLNGRNSNKKPGYKWTLHDLSRDLGNIFLQIEKEATNNKNSSPNYIFHLYGLTKLSHKINELKDYAFYGGTFVQGLEMLKNRHQPETIKEAILVLNMWMFGTHLLYDGLNKCQRRSNADDPDFITLDGGGLDEFISFWIGQNQEPATSEGYSLYAYTQAVSELYGEFDSGTTSGESSVNTKIKEIYQEGSTALSFPNACTKSNPNTVPSLYNAVHRIVTQMTIPLMKKFIYLLSQTLENGKDSASTDDSHALITLYAQAIIPQTSHCRPSTYKRLYESLIEPASLIDDFSGDFSADFFNNIPAIINDLQSVFTCLGFTCEDVYGLGYTKDDMPNDSEEYFCTSRNFYKSDTGLPLAEYQPSSSVVEQSQIDLDIRQIKILTLFGVYNYAKPLYMYGRNSMKERNINSNDPVHTRSLYEFATSSFRNEAAGTPYYDQFVTYHNNENYAHDVVIQIFDNDERSKFAPETGATSDQRFEVVDKTIRYQIMFMYALATLQMAQKQCEDGKKVTNTRVYNPEHTWDEGVAYIIGSMEGVEVGGSKDLDDGQLMWNLANKRSFQFGTVNKDGYANTNSELEDLFFAGKGELESDDCDDVKLTITRIAEILLVPLIQSTLRYAIKNEGRSSSFLLSQKYDLAEGETFTYSVLPIVADVNKDDAQILEDNMITIGNEAVNDNGESLEEATLVRDGPQGVADAFVNTLNALHINCDLIGSVKTKLDECKLRNDQYDYKAASSDMQQKKDRKWGLIIFVIVMCLAIICLMLAYVYLKQRKDDTVHEDETKGLTSNETNSNGANAETFDNEPGVSDMELQQRQASSNGTPDNTTVWINNEKGAETAGNDESSKSGELA